MITIEITGLDSFLAQIAPARLTQAIDKSVDRAAEVLRDHTKQMSPVSAKRNGYNEHGIPVDTGRMRQSIQKRKTQLLAAEVGAYVNYSSYVHDGGRAPARPFLLWSYQDGGESLMVQAVDLTLSRFLNGK